MRKSSQRVRLKYVCEGGGAYGLNIPASEYVEKGIRLIRTSDLAGGKLASEHDAIFVPDGAVALDDLLRPDDLLLSRSGTIGRAFLVPAEAAGATHAGFLVRFRTRPDVVPRYAYYCTQSADFQWSVQSEAITSTIQNFSAERYNNLAIPLPAIQVQRSIADYLDRDTARIDTLIDEQEHLVVLLRERRQAILDAAFADLSSFEVQLRRHIRFLTSGSRGWGEYYADGGERFLRIGNMPRTNLSIRGEIQFVDLPSGVTEGSRTILQADDLLFSITAYLGSVAVVRGDWVGAYVSQHVALCRLDGTRVDPRFIGWFMLTTAGQGQLKEGAVGGTKVQLALDDIKNLRVPAVGVEDQRRIATHVEEQTAKVDLLIAETKRFIELARERRSALITSAVTGQIDVRAVA